jgi:FAD/FMN-containing dehydrogenase
MNPDRELIGWNRFPDGPRFILLKRLGVSIRTFGSYKNYYTGVREDELDVFLTANDMMLKTVTAGGFFSLGGMTAVDVHGATINAPIFAETVSAFSIIGPDGQLKTINTQTPAVDGWSPLRFARVSLGALGVVTSVTVDVMPRR